MTQEEFQKAQQEAFAQQQILQQQLMQAQRWAQERQQMIDQMPRRRNVLIAAVDMEGGYSKDGKIPWDYPDDLKWFKTQTDGHICVMGKATYLDIAERLGDKASTSILPNRKCFVVSSTLDQADVPNATVIKSIYDVEMHLLEEDLEKRVYFIGGGRIFEQALSLVDTAVITAINQSFSCDKMFPIAALDRLFRVNRVLKNDTCDELRFVEFVRK